MVKYKNLKKVLMNKVSSILFLFLLTFSAMQCAPPSDSSSNTSEELGTELPKKIKRIGMVIQLKEEMIEEDRKIHATDNQGVRDLLNKYNMTNFSIFLHRLDDGNYYEFGYYEYVGDDFEVDMKKLAAEPRNQAWLEVCDPMQIPLEGYKSWADMELVYFNP